MNFLKNNDGIALITSLMFTALALVISMALLYMVTSGIKTSGALKRYRTALDATYGGTELVTKEIINRALAFSNYSSGSNSFSTYLVNELGTLNNPTFSDCFHMRLTTPRRLWSAACAAGNSNPTNSPDVSFLLNSTTGSSYRIYSKIVDTSEWKITSFPGTGVQVTNSLAGNSDPTGGGGSGVGTLEQGGTGRSSSGPELPHYPYIYKIEIQGQRQNSPMEKASVSVLYAY
jgi:hypothetical protein